MERLKQNTEKTSIKNKHSWLKFPPMQKTDQCLKKKSLKIEHNFTSEEASREMNSSVNFVQMFVWY